MQLTNTSHYNSHRNSLYTMFMVHLFGVKMLNAFSVPTLDSAMYSIPCVKSGVCRLTPDLCIWKFVLVLCLWSWQSMRSTVSCRAINGELSCDQRQAVNNAGGYAPSFHGHIICRCHGRVMCDVVPAVTSYRNYVRVAVDTLMTSHYSGDVMWIRTEVRVVGRIDAIRLKNASKSIFFTILKMLTWTKPGPAYKASFERKTPARQCATAENTRVKECAGTLLTYYRYTHRVRDLHFTPIIAWSNSQVA
jgi:hypothetical protein